MQYEDKLKAEAKTAAKEGRVIVATDFCLTDKDGNIRGRLNALDGMPMLTLYNLGYRIELTPLWFQAECLIEGFSRSVNLDYHRLGNLSLSFADDKNRTRVVLGATSLKQAKTGTLIEKSPCSLVFFDEDGNVIRELP